jgi:hypothetical protein
MKPPSSLHSLPWGLQAPGRSQATDGRAGARSVPAHPPGGAPSTYGTAGRY